MHNFKVGVLGTGNIGTDLLVKLTRLGFINDLAFVGRRKDSKGIEFVKNKFDVTVSSDGIDYFKDKNFNVVFDCTNADDATLHSEFFAQQNIYTIDLTPAKIGKFFIPVINPEDIKNTKNLNLITCGGQTSIPVIALVSKLIPCEYVEVVSQIAAKSAGLSTRFNIDNYIETTESAILQFSGIENSKVILNVNPAEPCVDMQTTIFFKTKEEYLQDLSFVNQEIEKLANKMSEYIPKYQVNLALTKIKNNIAAINLKVEGSGDYLPPYAGNLDIINCAAVKALELINEAYHN
jgi:acetaldehyde dehydrogenase